MKFESYSSITDGWEVAPVAPHQSPPTTGWIPAVIPGDIRSSLIAAGQMNDPLIGNNAASTNWVAESDWWYRRSLPPADSGQRFIVFKGIDYLAEVWFGGKLIGRAEGMFQERRYQLPPDAGWIEIRIAAPATLRKNTISRTDKAMQMILSQVAPGEYFPDRFATLKSPMTAGWDFAPALPTIGIWDDVLLHETGPVAIEHVQVTSRMHVEDASVLARLTLKNAASNPVTLQATLVPDGFESSGAVGEMTVEGNQATLRLELTQAKRWEPWERGEPHRYALSITALVDGEPSDSWSELIGVRSVTMARPTATKPSAGPAHDAVGLVVNGRPIFMRGANWVPPDSLLRLPLERYADLIEKAKDAGINLLRVWGGGLRERKSFYDECDRAGMLIWQEFPFSVAFFDHFPSDDGFLDIVEEEAHAIVRSVRNHPSVAVFCGGNEFSPSRNRKLVDRLAQSVALEDGTRPFRAASPGPAERHHWRVWHGWANLADYRNVQEPLLSEFGIQAAPDSATLQEAGIRPQDWEGHSAQIGKLERYTGRNFRDPDFAEATQRAQANALQIAIEHQRRRSGTATGTIIWQYNDPWPAISWSIIDYFGRPKMAMTMLKHSYAPLLISLDYPLRVYQPGEHFSAGIWIVDDIGGQHGPAVCIVRSGGEEIAHVNVRLPRSGSEMVGLVSGWLRVPDIEVVLEQDGKVLASNYYDLTAVDSEPTSLYHRFRDWVTWSALW